MRKKRPQPVVVAAYSVMLVIGILGVGGGALMRPGEKMRSVKYQMKDRGLGRGLVIAFSAGFALVGAFGIWDSLRRK